MHDSVLTELARRTPTNAAALLEIPGIGPKIVAKFGEALSVRHPQLTSAGNKKGRE